MNSKFLNDGLDSPTCSNVFQKKKKIKRAVVGTTGGLSTKPLLITQISRKSRVISIAYLATKEHKCLLMILSFKLNKGFYLSVFSYVIQLFLTLL